MGKGARAGGFRALVAVGRNEVAGGWRGGRNLRQRGPGTYGQCCGVSVSVLGSISAHHISNRRSRLSISQQLLFLQRIRKK